MDILLKKGMMILKLSPRLKKIASTIERYETIADIGTDHAYLPIYLIKHEKIKKAIASDINTGPIEIAKKRIKQYKVEQRIEVRKGSGLEILKVDEVEVIVIAGMGGILIKDILEADSNIAKSAQLLILQPMRDSEKIRMWLYENNCEIIDEELVKDDNKIYEIIWAVPSNNQQIQKDVMPVGKKIIEKKHPLAIEFVDKKINELEKVIQSLKKNDTENCKERINECIRLLDYYREVRKWAQ